MASNKARNKVRNQVALSPIQGVMPLSGGNQPAQVISTEQKQSLTKYITPVQLYRMKFDVRSWREAVAEAELAYYPQRIKMQRMFLDTALNGHVKACVTKRKRLTTLRQHGFFSDTDTLIETDIFKKKWFRKFLNMYLKF
jgi:hypothetical protein